jgi:hypothetical protein
MYFSILLPIILAGQGAFALPVAEAKEASADCPLGRSISFQGCLYKCAHPKDKQTVGTDCKDK